jgi:hypothetical protein
LKKLTSILIDGDERKIVFTTFTNALYSENEYALDLSAQGHVNINTSLLTAINNEVTFSFWAYGTASLMPAGTSILYGYATNPNDRGLNIHLPWNNNSIYFDCGLYVVLSSINMAIPKFKPLENASEGSKKIIKPVLGVVVALLLGAFGLTATNNDWNLNSILSGQSVSESKIKTDEKGNMLQNEAGDFITRVMRDKLGNVVPDNTTGAKFTDEYNCSDFDTQPEAQAFYDKAGGVKEDVNRLDANKDGVPCQSLQKGK